MVISSVSSGGRKTKHIDVMINFFQGAVQSGQLHLVYLPTTYIVADMMTKPLRWMKMRYILINCGLTDEATEVVLNVICHQLGLFNS